MARRRRPRGAGAAARRGRTTSSRAGVDYFAGGYPQDAARGPARRAAGRMGALVGRCGVTTNGGARALAPRGTRVDELAGELEQGARVAEEQRVLLCPAPVIQRA